ncbi:hypothetical protein KIH87_09875 [Paraneptunicella aestuarii]|uniref:hypothetical protein n=1 Tax=Paraneptunicella aestuarii TaxID=2831148 RepID=UPI001E39C3FF|nr:hypothetical protein [Paraneptunicella aestuarii]UAA40618.1 hypothetical protein KIH87_09875 [Paraneptunicella aestuarii]
MANKVLVTDVGTAIVGIQGVFKGRYTPYKGTKIIRALKRLEDADEFITYNGKGTDGSGIGFDLKQLNEFSLMYRDTEFSPKGTHTDMREIFWPNIIGSCLFDTFNRYCKFDREFADSYEGDNRRDVYMTLMLWKCWKSGETFQ